MKTYLLLVCILLSISNYAQHNFYIKGKIELHSNSKNIYLESRFGNFSCAIKEDSSFEFKGTITEVYSAFIKTDSSTVTTVWLEPGNYEILLKELPQKNKFKRLSMIALDGPDDAKVYQAFNQSIMLVPNVKKVMTRFLDSIFLSNPNTATLPLLLSLSQSFIGNDTTKLYVEKLNELQKKDESTLRILTKIQRDMALKTDKYLINFSLPNNNDVAVSLSEIIKNKKLILIDFWASWCAPCRNKHESLAKLYKNYAHKGLEIISISLDNEKESWLEAIKKDGMNWINVSELKGIANDALAKRYAIKSIPFSFWLKNDRQIITETEFGIKLNNGLMNEQDIIEFLK
ncbi:MAG: thioredoxin-like domain-containing protein [Chitinophagaceae bacterium]